MSLPRKTKKVISLRDLLYLQKSQQIYVELVFQPVLLKIKTCVHFQTLNYTAKIYCIARVYKFLAKMPETFLS